jgi:hypothetical protein
MEKALRKTFSDMAGSGSTIVTRGVRQASRAGKVRPEGSYAEAVPLFFDRGRFALAPDMLSPFAGCPCGVFSFRPVSRKIAESY